MRLVRFNFRCNILISGKIIKELPGLVGSGTPCITAVLHYTLLLDLLTYLHFRIMFMPSRKDFLGPRFSSLETASRISL
jgi:hypothetical protein